MSRKRYNPRLIKLHRSYSVEEAARALSVHKNAVRSWIKAGLPTLDGTRPLLIHGQVMRAYLTAKRKSAKRPCPAGTLYCLKCRVPRPPALGMVEFTHINSTTGNLRAFCAVCETTMHQRARADSLIRKMPNLDVQIREAPSRL